MTTQPKFVQCSNEKIKTYDIMPKKYSIMSLLIIELFPTSRNGMSASRIKKTPPCNDDLTSNGSSTKLPGKKRKKRMWICTLSKWYAVPVGIEPPPPSYLRQCIALFVVVEGWLLLNIGWFVLFLYLLVSLIEQNYWLKFGVSFIS